MTARRATPGARATHPGAGGFTLLEVVVALAILSMGLMAISDVVGGALRNHVRAHALDVATLLARGKMVALEDHYREEGFQDHDESDEGTFEAEGHPEVRWAVAVEQPNLDPGSDAACRKLLGDKGLEALLPKAPDDGGPQDANPMAASITALVKSQCTQLTQTLRNSVRELRLTVSWPEGARTESFQVVTDLVVVTPRRGQP